MDAKLSKNQQNEAEVTDVFASADFETISEDKENLAKRLDQILEVLNARIDTVKEQRKICNEMAVLAAQLAQNDGDKTSNEPGEDGGTE